MLRNFTHRLLRRIRSQLAIFCHLNISIRESSYDYTCRWYLPALGRSLEMYLKAVHSLRARRITPAERQVQKTSSPKGETVTSYGSGSPKLITTVSSVLGV